MSKSTKRPVESRGSWWSWVEWSRPVSMLSGQSLSEDEYCEEHWAIVMNMFRSSFISRKILSLAQLAMRFNRLERRFASMPIVLLHPGQVWFPRLWLPCPYQPHKMLNKSYFEKFSIKMIWKIIELTMRLRVAAFHFTMMTMHTGQWSIMCIQTMDLSKLVNLNFNPLL